jgi:hypothetical protein
MKKQFYPQITISGPESEIRAFVDREMMKFENSNDDFILIKTYVLSKEMKEILNYQCKIFNEPETENKITAKIEKQRVTGNFEDKTDFHLSSGIYTNKFLTLIYENIKILDMETNLISFAVDCAYHKIEDVWINYLKSEYGNIQFSFNTTKDKHNIIRYKSNLIISHGYYYMNNELIAEFEEGLERDFEIDASSYVSFKNTTPEDLGQTLHKPSGYYF